MMARRVRSLSVILQERAEEKGSEPLYSWWQDSTSSSATTTRVHVTRTLTYRDVLQLSWSVATILGEEGIPSGDRVLLVFEPGLTFIGAFLGCGAADVVAVPVFPPQPRKKSKIELEAFVRIQAGCDARLALTSQMYNWAKKTSELAAIPISLFSGGGDSLSWPKELRWVVVSDNARAIDAPKTKLEEAVAFLQYTSGSTSAPKGVMVTHACLDHNLSLIISELKAGTDTVVVSWLPQFHDMGLIGSYLGTMYCGGRGFYTSPVNFVKRPATWIEAISQFKGTHMQAPNFAYALAVRKFECPDGLDLSTARHFIDGAEPCDAEVIHEFEATFSPHGLRAGIIFPTYGLAEHTVLVSTNGAAKITLDPAALEEKRVVEAATGRLLCGCGKPPPGVRVAIVSTDNGRCVTDSAVGEIWLSSGSCAAGYFGKEPSQDDFAAKIDNDDDSGTQWLRTGDEGFLWHGEIVVCGRIKDLIILRGKNHYPQDVERTIERDSAVRAGCVAAFEDSEALVVVAEVREQNEADQLADRLIAAIAAEHGLSVARLVLLRPRTIPKTTSGKITRRRTKQTLKEGGLNKAILVDYRDNGIAETDEALQIAADESQPLSLAVQGSDLEARLAIDLASVSSTISADRIRVDLALSDLGTDSLELAQFRGLLESKYNYHNLPEDLLFRDDASIAVLATLIGKGEPFDENKYSAAVSSVARSLYKSGRLPLEIDQTAARPNNNPKGDWMMENCPCFLFCCPRRRPQKHRRT